MNSCESKEWSVALRPKLLDQMVGQEANRKIIEQWIAEDNLPGTLIFYGRSGSGKTTCARIIPAMLDGELIELDAASHNSVDDARQINELAGRLSLTGKHKIFLIDEAHMLSVAAFNALLKTIEEPNDKTHFILCTTEYSKLPLTIRGRSRMLKFYSLPKEQLKEYAEAVLEHMGYTLKPEVLELVISQSRGQVRDLLKLLQTVCEGNMNDIEELKKFLAIPDSKGMRNFINAVLDGKPQAGIKVINSINTDLLEWIAALQGHIYQLLEDKYNVTPIDFGTNIAQATKVKELENKFTDRQWGALLSSLNKIRQADTAYAQLYALLFAGV